MALASFQRRNAPGSDCVEVVVREVLEWLLFNPVTLRFELECLPSTCHPTLTAQGHLMEGKKLRWRGHPASC